MVEARIAAATLAFWAKKDFFLNNKISLAVRFSEFHKSVVPVLLYSLAFMNLDEGHCEKHKHVGEFLSA